MPAGGQGGNPNSVIDDTVVSTTKTWSSQNINDQLATKADAVATAQSINDEATNRTNADVALQSQIETVNANANLPAFSTVRAGSIDVKADIRTDVLEIVAGTNIAITADDANNSLTINNTYVHPSGDGNLHVPANGTTNDGKILRAGLTAGDIAWETLSAEDIINIPAGNIAAINVQAAINELDAEKAAAVHGHAATEISNTPAGNISATDVQGAINELNTEKVNVADVVTVATADKILKLNADAKLPTSITGDADTVDGKHAADFAANVHAHATADITDFPTSLPASGGDADTVDGKHAVDFATNVHAHVKADITDFPTSLPASGGDADTVDGKHAADFAASVHAHATADISDFPTSLPASGGDADTVDGKHAADFAASVHAHATADISDFPTSLPASGGDADTVDGKHAADFAASVHAHTKADIIDFPTSLPASGGDADTVDGKHAVDFAASVHAHATADITNFPTSLPASGGDADTVDGKHAVDFALSAHTHVKANITDFPTSLPANGGNADTVGGKHASDFCLVNDLRLSDARVANGGNADTVDGKHAADFATIAHTHVKASITDFPTSLPANGGNADTVDGKHSSDFAPFVYNVTAKVVRLFKESSTTASIQPIITISCTTGYVIGYSSFQLISSLHSDQHKFAYTNGVPLAEIYENGNANLTYYASNNLADRYFYVETSHSEVHWTIHSTYPLDVTPFASLPPDATLTVQNSRLYAGKNRTNMFWHEGNDGSGSGLDADTVDGYHASQLMGGGFDAGHSFAANGYQKLGNGLIFQWGTASPAWPELTVTFPVTFPNACLNIVGGLSHPYGPGAMYQICFRNVSTTSAQMASWNAPGWNIYWQAIGY